MTDSTTTRPPVAAAAKNPGPGADDLTDLRDRLMAAASTVERATTATAAAWKAKRAELAAVYVPQDKLLELELEHWHQAAEKAAEYHALLAAADATLEASAAAHAFAPRATAAAIADPERYAALGVALRAVRTPQALAPEVERVVREGRDWCLAAALAERLRELGATDDAGVKAETVRLTDRLAELDGGRSEKLATLVDAVVRSGVRLRRAVGELRRAPPEPTDTLTRLRRIPELVSRFRPRSTLPPAA